MKDPEEHDMEDLGRVASHLKKGPRTVLEVAGAQQAKRTGSVGQCGFCKGRDHETIQPPTQSTGQLDSLIAALFGMRSLMEDWL